ncbi:MAG: hypothetical protein NT080_01875 [Spirochaetes bacterium]|nr:hypothetical protein [Spirochaetota bacterium]
MSGAAVIIASLFFLWWFDDFEFQRALGFQVLPDGRILVTDGGGADFSDTGSKVFIIDRSGRVTWKAKTRLRFAHSAVMLSNGHVLVPDTNADRLVELDGAGKVAWTSQSWGGGTGLLSDGTKLDYPNHATELPNGHFLVSGRYNDLVFETDREGTVFWAFRGAKRQHAPRRLPDGNTLIADSDGNRIIEIDNSGAIVWSYSEGLNWPRFAQRLPDGNTLIADSDNDRILEVTPTGDVVFEYGRGVLSKPYQVEELPGGTILIADAQHGRLVEIDRTKKVVWTYRRRNLLKRWLSMPGILVNGGAEAVNGTGVPSDWVACDLLAPDAGVWTGDTVIKRSGHSSFSIRGNEGEGLNRFWGQYIKANAGETIVLRAYIKTESVAQGAGLSVNFVDRTGGIQGGVNSVAVSGDSDWKETVIIAPVPEGAAVIGVTLSLIGPGSAWWDDVTFESRPVRRSKPAP